jgi:hypothetical protein
VDKVGRGSAAAKHFGANVCCGSDSDVAANSGYICTTPMNNAPASCLKRIGGAWGRAAVERVVLKSNGL